MKASSESGLWAMEISRRAAELAAWDFGSLTGRRSFQGNNGSASWMRKGLRRRRRSKRAASAAIWAEIPLLTRDPSRFLVGFVGGIQGLVVGSFDARSRFAAETCALQQNVTRHAR